MLYPAELQALRYKDRHHSTAFYALSTGLI